jgi:hypothetical protein
MKSLARTLVFALTVALFPAAVGCGDTKSDKPADTNPPQTGSPPAQPAKDQKGKLPVITTGADK